MMPVRAPVLAVWAETIVEELTNKTKAAPKEKPADSRTGALLSYQSDEFDG